MANDTLLHYSIQSQFIISPGNYHPISISEAMMGSGIQATEQGEEFSLKVSHGNEIRRVTLKQVSYAALCAKVSDLFLIPVPAISLKYQDDDGDRITMVCPGALLDNIKPLVRSFP